jgi:hypothetical protein
MVLTKNSLLNLLTGDVSIVGYDEQQLKLASRTDTPQHSNL